MKHYIICSLTEISANFVYLNKLRKYILNKDEIITDDWVEYNLIINQINQQPNFVYQDQKNYLSEALSDIKSSDIIHFFFTKPSSYLTTLFRYAIYHDKIIMIYSNNHKIIPTHKKSTKIHLIKLTELTNPELCLTLLF